MMSINCFNFAELEIKSKYRKIQIIMTFALIMNDWNNYREQYKVIWQKKVCFGNQPCYIAPKTEVWRLFFKFFTANILFREYLGVVCFRPKNQRFLQEKDPATLSHEQGTHSAKIVPIVWLEIAKMPPKISAQFVCSSPKVSNF